MTTNNLMQKLQDKIQSTDYIYAGKLEALKGRIENQLARIGNIRDSFGNKFTTEACGVVYFGSSTGSILNNPTSFLNPWDTFGRILQQPAEQITDAEFGHLAWFFTLQTTIEGQERFLNLFLEPVTPPNATNPHRVNAFAVCPQKVGGVQWFINAGIRDILHEQMVFVPRSQEYEALQAASDILKDRSALLSVINSLTTSLPAGASWDNPDTLLKQNVILGIGDGRPITLTQNARSVSVNFNRGVVYATPPLPFSNNLPRASIQPVSTAGPPIWDDAIGFTRQINSSSKTISSIFGGVGLHGEFDYALGNHFYVQHQFDVGGFFMSQVKDFVFGLVTSGFGDAASTAIGIIQSLAGLPPEMQNARNIQNDIIEMTDGAAFGRYQEHFALRGVVITSTDQSPQVISWPTTNTLSSLNALNRLLSDNRDSLGDISRTPNVITQPFFTWQQFLQNPYMIFEVHASLNGDGLDDLADHIEDYRAIRNYRLENPSSLQMPDPSPDGVYQTEEAL